MNKKFANKIFLIICLYFVFACNSVKADNTNTPTGNVSDKTCQSVKNQIDMENHRQFIKTGDYILIKIFDNPPLYLEDQRKEAFDLLKPYLNNNTAKASVAWQKDKFSYGEIASIPNVYIDDYLIHKNNIDKEKQFISLFTLEGIEPEPLYNCTCPNSVSQNVSDSDLKKIAGLSEKAEIYRLSGKNDSAKRIYSQVLDINPNDVIAMFWLAEIYKTEKNISRAKEYYQKVVNIDPCFWAANKALSELK